MIKNSLIRARRLMLRAKYSEVLPRNPLHNDVYLVSYPKSGVTWLSYLMANVHFLSGGMNVRTSYYNLDNYIPDIHQNRDLSPVILPFPGFRIIKSHSQYNPFYRKIVYLLRDPRDVLLSYYHFSRKLGWCKMSLSRMIRSRDMGICSWCDHVRGWMEKTKEWQCMHLVRYEDMKNNAKLTVGGIYRTMGFDIKDEILDEAIGRSSFDEMRKDEESYSRGNPSRDPEFRFCRTGVVSANHKEHFKREDLEYINEKAGRWLDMFGYNR